MGYTQHCNSSLQNRLNILHGGTIASMVDLGGSLAVASRGLYSTGVSTDLNGTWLFLIQSALLFARPDLIPVTYLNSGGKIGDLIRAVSSQTDNGSL